MNEQTQFLKYVRTKMIFSLGLRNENDLMQPGHIGTNEIQERFFIGNYKDQIRELVDTKELEVTQNGLAYYYKALKPGGYDLSLLISRPIPEDIVTQTMLKHLKSVSLPKDAATTDYFNLFLKYRNIRPDLFFKVDTFCGRVHTPISNFHRTHRPNLKLYGKDTTGLDVQTMQPLLLGKILNKEIGENDFSKWLNEGKDIYLMLQDKAGINTRDEAKKRFFEILFSVPNEDLAIMFGEVNWIKWINDYKSKPEPRNKKVKYFKNGSISYHNNLAWLLQNTEVQIMRKVWNGLVNAGIPFFSIHDEVIIQTEQAQRAMQIFSDIMAKEFTYFKINGNKLPDLSKPEQGLIETIKSKPEKISEQPEPQQPVFEQPQPKEIIPIQELQAIDIKNKCEFTLIEQKQPSPRNWDKHINELENFFTGITILTHPVQLKQAESIQDVTLFIESHFATVKANNGKRTFLPYLNRLQELKQYLTTN